MDQVNVEAWVGRTLSDRGGVDVRLAAQLHATLGRSDIAAPAEGDLLPGLWHWCAFPPLASMEQLGPDGHPGGGTLLPVLHLPRRMWAGGSLTFHAPLRVGDTMIRHSSVHDITSKKTAAGDMVLVTVNHAIHGPRGLAITERQDIVYLPIPDQYEPPRKRALDSPVCDRVETTPPLLFRYSALTFNAHRIHYDLDYTRSVEHYPDLIVHGPLQATCLMRRAFEAEGRPPTAFSFRAVHPMFATGGMDIAMREEDGGLTLWSGQDGHQCMTATAIWDGTP